MSWSFLLISASPIWLHLHQQEVRQWQNRKQFSWSFLFIHGLDSDEQQWAVPPGFMLMWAQLHQEASSVDFTVSDSAPTDFSNRLSLCLTGKRPWTTALLVWDVLLGCFHAWDVLLPRTSASPQLCFTLCMRHCVSLWICWMCFCVWLFVSLLLLPPVLSFFFLCALFLLCCVSTTCVEMTNECVFHRLFALPSLSDLWPLPAAHNWP